MESPSHIINIIPLSISMQDSIVGVTGDALLTPLHDTTLNASNNAKGIIASQVDEIAYLFVIEDVYLVRIFLQ